MADGKKPDQEEVGKTVKRLSYIVTVVLAVVTGSVVYGVSSNAAVSVVVTALSFVLLNLGDVRSNIVIVLADSKSTWEAVNRVLARPKIDTLRRSMNRIIGLWHNILLRPIQYASTTQYQVFANARAQAWLGVAASLSLLTLVNALTISLVKLCLTGECHLLGDLLAWWFAPTVVFVWAAFSPSQRGSRVPFLREDPGFSGFAWGALLLSWSSVAWGRAYLLSWRIFIDGFLAGLALAPLFKQRVVFERKVVQISFGLALLIATVGAALTPSEQFIGNPAADPTLASVYRIWKGDEAVSSEDDPKDTDDDMLLRTETSEDPGELLSLFPPTPVFLSFATIILVGSFLGAMTGLRGLLLRVIEAPLFYGSWLWLTLKRTRQSALLVCRAVNFDELRIVTWSGEEKCYAQVLRCCPELAIPLLASQVFYTPRHDFAVRYLTEFVASQELPQALSVLVPLLPYRQFEHLSSPIRPDIALLSSSSRDELFETVYSWRRSVFAEMLEYLVQDKSKKYDGLLLRGLDTLATSDWADSESGRDDALIVRNGFAQYSQMSHADVVFALADATYGSLSVTDLGQIGDQAETWHHLEKAVKEEVLYAYLIPYAQTLSRFAATAGQDTPGKQAHWGELALQIFDLQARLEQSTAETTFGLAPISLVAKHWAALLRACIREKPAIMGKGQGKERVQRLAELETQVSKLRMELDQKERQYEGALAQANDRIAELVETTEKIGDWSTEVASLGAELEQCLSDRKTVEEAHRLERAKVDDLSSVVHSLAQRVLALYDKPLAEKDEPTYPHLLTIGVQATELTERRGLTQKVHKVVYYDPTYPGHWMDGENARMTHDYFVDRGFVAKDAGQLRDWIRLTIERRFASRSLAVFAQDVFPDTVLEVCHESCLLRKYLNAGGRVVWQGDIPCWYQGKPGGAIDEWREKGPKSVLGVDYTNRPVKWRSTEQDGGRLWDNDFALHRTSIGQDIGLSYPGKRIRIRPVPCQDVTVAYLVVEPNTIVVSGAPDGEGDGYTVCWKKNFNERYPYSGFLQYVTGEFIWREVRPPFFKFAVSGWPLFFG